MERRCNKVYIGDGVYATWNGWDVAIETERENGTHWIVLEPGAVQQLAEMVRHAPAPEERPSEPQASEPVIDLMEALKKALANRATAPGDGERLGIDLRQPAGKGEDNGK